MRFGDKADSAAEKFFKSLSFTLKDYDAALGSDDFFAGDAPLMGDFGLFHAFDLCLVGVFCCWYRRRFIYFCVVVFVFVGSQAHSI